MNASKSEKLKSITKILNGFNKLNLCPSCESRNLFFDRRDVCPTINGSMNQATHALLTDMG
jgi:hypothetical protein